MPVPNSDPRWLTATVESVLAQLYPHWELCISDGASTVAGACENIATIAQGDGRIRVQLREEKAASDNVQNLSHFQDWRLLLE
jgi:glycosyltransferase involved in cell wall biosynthesis